MSEPVAAAQIEIATARPERTDAYWRDRRRDFLSELWSFRVVWHEQTHELIATHEGAIVGALRLRIAASLAHLEALFVDPEFRGIGIGPRLLAEAEDIAVYYNCHKVTLEVPSGGHAQTFFERNDYRVEALLQQHTFKLDVAVLRKFLL